MENQIVFYGDNSVECNNKALRWFYSIGGVPINANYSNKVERTGDKRKIVLIVTFPITTEQMAWKIINELK
tara:strand:- start:509 stop:721 length:213 start_codon:yes stop_codon:yes gene_type:complete